MFMIRFLSFALLCTLLWWNCSEDNPVSSNQGTDPEVSDLKAPDVVYNQSTKKYLISVKVGDPQGLTDIEDVSYRITRSGAGSPATEGELFDDGFGGDVIPKDGVFSTTIQGTFAQGDSGQYEISVTARDKSANSSTELKVDLFVLDGIETLAPKIVAVDAPGSVPVDSSAHDVLIAVQIFDSEGLSDIRKVSYQFFPPANPTPTLEGTMTDSGTNGDLVAGDGIYSVVLSSSLFTELTDYSVRIQAEDAAGNQSAPEVVTIRGRIKIGTAPAITAVAVPRIIKGNEMPQVLITADVFDRDGLADIETVQYRLFITGGGETGNSPLFMADDGDLAVSGDSTAGDGIFSNLLNVPTSGSEPVDFTLRFIATDKSGASSGEVGAVLVVTFDDAPYISRVVAPSMVQINPNQDIKILITVDARDPQGQGNISTVWFRSFKPDGVEAGNSPIFLFDSGNMDEGDGVAGDGIYSRFIFLPSQGVTPGDFRFVFEAFDREANASNKIEHIMTVTQ